MSLKRKLKPAFKRFRGYLFSYFFKFKNKSIQRKSNCYCFVSNGKPFSGNMKAVFDYVKDNETIKKIVLMPAGNFIDYQDKSIVVIHSQFNRHFHQASIVICDQMLSTYRVFRCSYLSQVPIVNVWHGIPMKKMFLSAQRKNNPFSRNEKEYTNIITSSVEDAKAMNMCFDLPPNNIHITGLPRVDLLLSPTQDIEFERNLIRKSIQGLRLVLFAPTWRDDIDGYYQFKNSEVERFSRFLNKHNMVLGIREHFITKEPYYFNQFKSIGAISFANNIIYNIEALLLEASVLITDYSSCYFDFLLLGKPALCFAFDYDRYNSVERGFFYELSDLFERKISFSFDDIIDEMGNLSESELNLVNEISFSARNHAIIDQFFQFKDANNTKRVISLIERLAKETAAIKKSSKF